MKKVSNVLLGCVFGSFMGVGIFYFIPMVHKRAPQVLYYIALAMFCLFAISLVSFIILQIIRINKGVKLEENLVKLYYKAFIIIGAVLVFISLSAFVYLIDVMGVGFVWMVSLFGLIILLLLAPIIVVILYLNNKKKTEDKTVSEDI